MSIPKVLSVTNYSNISFQNIYLRLWKISEISNNIEEPSLGLTQDLKAKILQYILIPSFAWSFDHGEGEKLIGSPPAPDIENDVNVVSSFILNIIDPDNPFGTSDNVRILILQFSCLLVDQVSYLISPYPILRPYLVFYYLFFL